MNRDDWHGFLTGVGVGLTIATVVLWVASKIGGAQ